MALRFSSLDAYLEASRGSEMPTLVPKESEIERKWFIVDANGQVLGRLASRIASILRGRDKQYRWHSGYIGGLREVNAETMLRTHPERVIEWAVQGMLPKTRLGRAMAKKMKVYRGAAHPHQAQQPEALTFKSES